MQTNILQRIKIWRPGNYLRDSTVVFIWLLIKTAAQGAAIILLARFLGSSEYGVYIATLAIAGIFSSAAGIGMNGITLRDGAQNPEQLPQLLWSALKIWLLSTTAVSILSSALLSWISSPSLPNHIAIFFASSEITSSSLVELCARAFQSQKEPKKFGYFMGGLAITRLVFLLTISLEATPKATDAMITYSIGSLIYASISLFLLCRRFSPRPRGISYSYLLREGAPSLIGALSYRLQSELNKPLLAQIGFSQAASFNVAQRFIEFGSMPIFALQEAFWPRVFASKDPRKTLLTTGSFLVATAIICGLFLLLAAPLLPYVFGPSYSGSVYLIGYLAWFPTLQVIRTLCSTSLVISRQTNYVTFALIVSTLLGAVLTAIGISSYGIMGAAFCLYLNEAILIATFLVKIYTSPPYDRPN